MKRKTMVMDGNEAAAHVAYAFTEVAAIYPITPSSPMAEKTDEWSAGGRKNLFGQTVTLVEMQSEAGAIGAVHGACEAGALATSFTSSQGLMLMIPVLHRISGTRQPAVLHVASRTVGTHAMSIFGDHSDVMNCRQTGFGQLSSGSVQEVMDLAGVAHLAAIKGKTPFMHFFDGFRTSHELQKIEVMEYEELGRLLDRQAVENFRAGSLNPEHPTLRNTVQNPDVYFQVREANNLFYEQLPDIVEEYMEGINRITGRSYKLFNYFGAPDAERVIVAMGSVSGAIEEAVEVLCDRGEKVGFLQVHLYRPFSVRHFLDQLPATVKRIAVLDRCKEMGAAGEPLYQDVCSVFINEPDRPEIYGGRYGLSSKDTDPGQIKAVFDHLTEESPLNGFTIGIVDDVTNLSLTADPSFALDDEGTVNCKFWGLGSDGTVGANKNSIKIIGDYTDMYAQAYFEYDTKKSYGITKSHLRFGKSPIRSTYLVKRADFVACHNQSYLYKYDMITELKEGGTFLLNCDWPEEALSEQLPGEVKKYIADHGINFYIIDANRVSQGLGLGDRANTVLQAAFFSLADIIPVEDAVKYMKDAVEKTYRLKGREIVELNMAAIDSGITGVKKVSVPEEWKNASAAPAEEREDLPPFIRDILIPINAQKGDSLPVSAFVGYEDGTMPLGTTAYEKRGIATRLPVWNKEACLQCNRCAFVCPHAVLRPYLLDEKEAGAAPEGFEMCQAKGGQLKEYQYSIQVSALDCTGCGSCASVCPAKEKAIVMKPVQETAYHPAAWEYGLTITEKEGATDPATVKGSQFRQPLCEFSGACAGCGETPYAKLLTQLFGDKIYWANATGCSQAWGAAMPSIPYTTNKEGKGPAWSNSLFENNAEFSLGMCLAVKQQRSKVREKAEKLLAFLEAKEGRCSHGERVYTALKEWLATYDDINASGPASKELAAAMEAAPFHHEEAAELAADILRQKDQLTKKTIWMYGGDGWAYDIGYGGLDHVFALGEDVNVFVVDTEVYSNTGGQSSKATPLGAVAQFQASGKKSPKKDLGKLMMSYGHCYVASVAMGADPNQLMKALVEAERYPGPSLIVAYTPCIAHGIKAGMDSVQEEMKRAVEAGYWTLYRYDPSRKEKPFILDSKEPTLPYKEFLAGEVRYSSLGISFPENAETLFERAEELARENYEKFRKMAE
ncbi:MAG: pyruvate:ferredoxin (flavodoxin) oxidoreductase [Bacillota bacterium]|nr:pyruvate:ferredoxin (flavodoxin) oxidoreductase [Bacillota bacterium]